ncbi:hypothetical protein NDU88_001917 [Pleurodeles waltl]|uniref:Uncharacterized protein n=1 Tax=Pleurodeles waltl TaxID=8319 RepID=A0AAV7KSR3_PLEWA|nr:hypothetical protein NDU88_001917 [Pleurodeles waltl]
MADSKILAITKKRASILTSTGSPVAKDRCVSVRPGVIVRVKEEQHSVPVLQYAKGIERIMHNSESACRNPNISNEENEIQQKKQSVKCHEVSMTMRKIKRKQSSSARNCQDHKKRGRVKIQEQQPVGDHQDLKIVKEQEERYVGTLQWPVQVGKIKKEDNYVNEQPGSKDRGTITEKGAASVRAQQGSEKQMGFKEGEEKPVKYILEERKKMNAGETSFVSYQGAVDSEKIKKESSTEFHQDSEDDGMQAGVAETRDIENYCTETGQVKKTSNKKLKEVRKTFLKDDKGEYSDNREISTTIKKSPRVKKSPSTGECTRVKNLTHVMNVGRALGAYQP